MQFSKSIDGFVLSRLADGYAPVTLRGYRSSLGILAEYLHDPEIEAIAPEDLKGFMRHIRTTYKPVRKSGSEEPLTTASHHRYWKAIRSFFKWADEELKTGRPDLDLKMPKYTTREIVPFTFEELERMLKACDNCLPVVDGKRKPYQCKRPTAARDRALLMLLTDTGVRSGECARLKIRDTNLENGEVNVAPYHVGKTKPRTVYLGKTTKKVVWRYLSGREDFNDGDPLFVTVDNHPMSQESIKSIVYTVANIAKVQNAHPHRFRHTFAIQYLRNGGDVFTLQRLLGHSTLEMVRHYLALANADSATAHQRSSPVDRWHL